jgi:hypothetical protein
MLRQRLVAARADVDATVEWLPVSLATFRA